MRICLWTYHLLPKLFQDVFISPFVNCLCYGCHILSSLVGFTLTRKIILRLSQLALNRFTFYCWNPVQWNAWFNEQCFIELASWLGASPVSFFLPQWTPIHHPSPSIPILDTWLPTFNATVSGRARLPHLLPSPQRRQRRQSQCHHGRRGGAGRIQRIHLANLENWRDKYIYIPWLESLKAT